MGSEFAANYARKRLAGREPKAAGIVDLNTARLPASVPITRLRPFFPSALYPWPVALNASADFTSTYAFPKI